ncbi:MAG TPA: FG-GAP-like repeat-containing protein, partial [Hymenobacter sp.]|nr:FG-GAP-like repeat-containing protein [Hymenobacter sp.]
MVSIPGAAWLQLQFSEVNLGPNGVLIITDASGQSQTFSQAQIYAWRGLSVVFNGSELRVSLRPGKGATTSISAKIKDIIIGLPASAVSGAEVVTPQPLRNLLGSDIKRFISDDLRERRGNPATESICGAADNRVASANPRVGRIMPIGCTGWLVEGGIFLTAGHCISPNTQTVQFNVPASQADGTPVAPPVQNQYRVIAESINSQYTRGGPVGNDWAVFRVLPNTQTGLMPAAAQGATFQLSNTANPAQVRVTGYGVDGPAPRFGEDRAPRNAQNQTQQTHVGTLFENTGGPALGVLRYNADTQPANSGSPVIVEGGNTAIGIHTDRGCTANGGTNAGTSFRNVGLWTAINNARTKDILWQNTNGTVHYWPIREGQRQGGFNISTPVASEWKLIGPADLNGDGTDDILWRHTNGTVHYWPIRNGQRQGGFDIGTPVGLDWSLIVADLNGDGTDDILWRHNKNGTVHYWKIQNGQRQAGF